MDDAPAAARTMDRDQAMTMMNRFSVHIETRAPEDAPYVVIDEHAADQFMDLLANHDGVVASGSVRWDATVGIQAPDPVYAATMAAEIVDSMAVKSGMPRWPIVRIDTVREDILDEDIARSTLPDLVSISEAAEILGVSPQWVHEFAADGWAFPKPVYELKAGKVWLRAAIEAFRESADRSPSGALGFAQRADMHG
jgi:predicted DNA-binding transcriptional regulator AlpA